MVEVILTEAQQIQCSTQILDLMLKAAVAGAIGCVIWNALVVKGKDPAGWLERRFSRKNDYGGIPFGGGVR